MTSNQLILLVSLFVVVTGNFSFFANVLKIYPLASGSVAALLSLVVALYVVTVLLLAPLCIWPRDSAGADSLPDDRRAVRQLHGQLWNRHQP